MPIFDSSSLHQFSKFKNFLLVFGFLGKNLSNFSSPIWKLHNPYCHLMTNKIKYISMQFILGSCGKDKECVPAQSCPFSVYLNDTFHNSEDPEARKRAGEELEESRCYIEAHPNIITACTPCDSVSNKSVANVDLPYKFRKWFKVICYSQSQRINERSYFLIVLEKSGYFPIIFLILTKNIDSFGQIFGLNPLERFQKFSI